ncbi:MAG: type II toxin-antitoxin system VapC family toxin [Rhizobiaceae bacterium]
MTSTLIDTNIIVDVLGPQNAFRAWSVVQLARLSEVGRLLVGQIVYSELAASFSHEIVQRVLNATGALQENLSFDAAWQGGLAHGAYRRAGGLRDRTLPDFLIGAQAAQSGYALLTRDPKRYRTYFPELYIIAPDTHP